MTNTPRDFVPVPREALERARSVIDKFMGDSDLLDDDSDEMAVMQELSNILDADASAETHVHEIANRHYEAWLLSEPGHEDVEESIRSALREVVSTAPTPPVAGEDARYDIRGNRILTDKDVRIIDAALTASSEYLYTLEEATHTSTVTSREQGLEEAALHCIANAECNERLGRQYAAEGNHSAVSSCASYASTSRMLAREIRALAQPAAVEVKAAQPPTIDFGDLPEIAERNRRWKPSLQELVHQAIAALNGETHDSDEDAAEQVIERLLIELRKALTAAFGKGA